MTLCILTGRYNNQFPIDYRLNGYIVQWLIMINWYTNLDNLKWPHPAFCLLIFLLSYVECQNCPPLRLPAYGEWPTGSCVNTVGQRCLFGCQRGFELIGSSHRTCCDNGSWTKAEYGLTNY